MEGNISESGKFNYMKQFVIAGREYIASRNENALKTMNKMLGMISSAEGITFCPGRIEVNAFFGSLYEVLAMGPSGLPWLAVSVLGRAIKDQATKKLLVQSYKFLPILSTLLTDGLSIENKIKLLSLIEVLTDGVKITWQESYLVELLKLLSSLAMNYVETDSQSKRLSLLALSVLANLCYGNLCVVYILMRTVDTRQLIKSLVSMKGNEATGVHVCRLLMSLQGVQGAPTANDVHNFLGVSLRAFTQGIKDCDPTILRHSSSFLADLCSDKHTKSYIICYERFEPPLQEALKMSPYVLFTSNKEEHGTNSNLCLYSTLKYIENLVNLELYSIRSCHGMIAELCVKSSDVADCRGPAFALLAALVSQYQEDGMLPDDVMAPMSIGLTGLLSPNLLDPTSSGLEWLKLLMALSDCNATQDGLIHNVKTDQFEDVVYRILHNATMIGAIEETSTLESVLVGCRLCLSLASRNSTWDDVLHRMLANKSVQTVLTYCLSVSNNSRRKETLQIITHPHFPLDKINQVFCSSCSKPDQHVDKSGSVTDNLTELPTGIIAPSFSSSLTPNQEQMLNKLIKKFEDALLNDKINDINISNLIELYSYKMKCLESRLHASSVGLQGATHNVASLNHAMSLIQTVNRSQEDILYKTQTHNERLQTNVTRLSAQLNDAEMSICKFQGKLAAERLDREQQNTKMQWQHTQNVKELESEIETKTAEAVTLNAKLAELETANNIVKERLSEQTIKNSELAGVLVKFEERVKQRDRKLEEATALQSRMKSDMEESHQTIKVLEKTILERDKRLSQVTTQLEEMHRVQDIIASLMGNKGVSTNNSNSSMS